MPWQPQTSLGGIRSYPVQAFRDLKLCRIASISDLLTTGRVSVVTQDGGAPVAAMVLTAYKPPELLSDPVRLAQPVLIYEVGDSVLVGFIDGQKDNPIVLGHVFQP